MQGRDNVFLTDFYLDLIISLIRFYNLYLIQYHQISVITLKTKVRWISI